MFTYVVENRDPKGKIAAVTALAENPERTVKFANDIEPSTEWVALEARHHHFEGILCAQPKTHGAAPKRRQL